MKVRTDEKRDSIVDEAQRLFLELGYERATMGELNRRIGGSKATLYGYFRSKQELFVAVTERLASGHLADAIAELDTLAQLGVERGLTGFAHKMLVPMASDAGLALQRMIIGESGRSEVGEIFIELGPRRCLGVLTSALRAAMDRGDLQPGPADLLAIQFMGLVRAEIDLRPYLRQPVPLDPAQLKAMAQRAVTLFLGGYRMLAAVAAPAARTPADAGPEPADGDHRQPHARAAH